MSTERKDTKYGPVFRGSTCCDDFSNILTNTVGGDHAIGGPETYKLQSPAITSLRRVAERTGTKMPWRKNKRPVHVTGTWRSCAFQAECYARDPGRYAPPNVGLHTQGLAIDVDMNWYGALTPRQQRRFRYVMKAEGWTQARPSDEPWHFSYGWTA